MKKEWEKLNAEIKACHKCPVNVKNPDGMKLNTLGLTENAPGFGNKKAKVMLIGQSLCRQCMAAQEPFYLESGLLLDDIFELLGRKKDEFFITNVVHCHPPGNAPNQAVWVDNCTPFLKREILLVQPKLIIPLGRDAVTRCIGKFGSMASVMYKPHALKFPSHGKVFTVRPAFHPAYFWRKGRDNPETRAYVKGMAKLIEPYLRGEGIQASLRDTVGKVRSPSKPRS